jgi:ankyrin repeat protein
VSEPERACRPLLSLHGALPWMHIVRHAGDARTSDSSTSAYFTPAPRVFLGTNNDIFGGNSSGRMCSADITSSTALMLACKHSHLPIVKFLANRRTPLVALQRLHHADAQAAAAEAMIGAIRRHDAVLLAHLLEAGKWSARAGARAADVADVDGRTPLHAAVLTYNKEVRCLRRFSLFGQVSTHHTSHHTTLGRFFRNGLPH